MELERAAMASLKDRGKSDRGRLIVSSMGFPRLDLEEAAGVLAELGVEAIEPHIAQMSPSVLSIPISERHAEVTGEVIRAAALEVSSFTVIDAPSFRPFDGTDAASKTAQELATHLRMAAAMGAPRLIVWDGRADAPGAANTAAETLSRVIAEAQGLSRLNDPPPVSVELHPFTFALKYGRLGEIASALTGVGAGICLDFCHFGVTLGPDFMSMLDDAVLDAVNHVHFTDTDCRTSELHLAPGRGVLNMNALAGRLANRGLSVAWDLFSNDGPRVAIREHLTEYREFVSRVNQ